MAYISMNDEVYESSHFARMSGEQCRRIHWASLEILERVGVRLHLQEAVDLLRRAGADVTDGNLVRIPAGLVEKAMSTVPKRVVLCDRSGRGVMPLAGHRCFYGPGSDCMNILDHRTGERREPVLQDVVEGVRLCDALPNVDFVMSMVLPTDVDMSVADRYQMDVMLNNTTKPIVIVSYELEGLVDSVEMAEAVVGQDFLRRNPMVTAYINVISGFQHNEEALQKLLYLSGKRLPSLYIPLSTTGVNSPITIAGTLAVDNAGVLTGLVLSQLNREGAPYIMTGMATAAMDMRTMCTLYAEPERATMQNMAHFYGLPMFGEAGCSDSKALDQQAGVEAALTLMAETLAGTNMMHDMGYLESGMTFSFAQLAICDEIVSWMEAYFKGIDVSDEALSLDLIAEIGPDGEFLDTDHTYEHFRERWYPRLLDRNAYDTWDGRTLGERAAERVDRILEEHRPEPLPADAQKRIKEIVRRVENR